MLTCVGSCPECFSDGNSQGLCGRDCYNQFYLAGKEMGVPGGLVFGHALQLLSAKAGI